MSDAPAPYDYLEPGTIIPDRYSRTYSGAPWLAFPLQPPDVPDEPSGGDIIAASWWDQAGDAPVGRGDTPTMLTLTSSGDWKSSSQPVGARRSAS